jgi:hypothetical protein
VVPGSGISDRKTGGRRRVNHVRGTNEYVMQSQGRNRKHKCEDQKMGIKKRKAGKC